MKKFLKENIDIIILIILLIILILLNIRPNKIIMGLDNSSPYFDPITILKRITGTSAIVYGGIAFQIPFLGILNRVGISPELLSNIYVFANFFFGTLGISLLLKKTLKNNLVTIIGTILFLSNLFVFWVFGHPSFLFITAFGSVPMLIYLLLLKDYKWYTWVLLVIFSISFLTTTLNIVAFLSYTISILVLVLILSENRKQTIKKFIIWALSLLLLWFATIQIVMYTNGDTTFFPVRIYEYTQELLNNPYVNTSTEGIIASEKTNTLVRTLSFSLGWMELHDSNNTTIFQYYSTYRENSTYIILGLIPAIIALLAIFIKQNKRNLLLTISFVFFVSVSSRYGIELIEKVPYLNSSLRWASSKFWPLYIFPLVLLASATIKKILENKKTFVKFILIFTVLLPLTIYSLPVLKGNLLSPQTLVNIPEEYFTIPNDSQILILPHAQKLYMRQYDWGYYGSDFLVHITNSQIVDGTNIFEYGQEFEEIFNTNSIPDDIQYILYDYSAETNLSDELFNKSKYLVEDFSIINSNEYFTIYER